MIIDGGKLTIGEGTIYLYGAYSDDGPANNNEVIITGGDTASCMVYGGYGKFNGSVNENKVSITDGRAALVAGGRSEKYVYVNSNSVTLQNTTVTGDVYGGKGLYPVNSNQVLVKGGKIEGTVYGGYSGGNVSNNQIEITENATINNIYGGYSVGPKSTANANTVKVTSGTAKTVWGGRVTKGSETIATENQVLVSGGTVENIYGGSACTEASGNTVTISGGTITGNVFGGQSTDSNTATNNKIILAQGAANANLKSATLYGYVGFNSNSSVTNHSGNTLTVEKEKNITLATVKNFDVYDFQLGDVKNGDVILNLLNDTNLGNATVKVANAGNVFPTDITGDRVLYLMKLADGKTLTFNGTVNVDGFTPISKFYQNDTNTATFTMSRTAGRSGNNLAIYDKVAYTCDLSPEALTNGAKLLSYENTGAMTLTDEDVTLNNANALDGKQLSLNKGDKVYLLENTAGGALTYTGTNGENQTLNHTYKNNTDAGTATVTTHAKVEASGNDLILNVDGVKYAFTLAPTAKGGDVFLTSTNTGTTKIYKDDVKVTASDALKNLKENDKVYLIKTSDGGTLTADGTKDITLPIVFQNVTGTVAAADNNLVLTITNAESLAPADASYKYIVIVEDATKSTRNEVTVGADENADKSAIAALAKDEKDATELSNNALTVAGTVTGRAVGANSVAGNATKNTVTIGSGATVNGFVAGGMTADGVADGNTVTINGGKVTGDVYGGYSEKAATNNIVNLAGGTITGTVYGGYVDASEKPKYCMPRRALAATTGSTSGNTLNVTKETTAGNIAKFNTYNFVLPTGTSADDKLLHLTDAADTDLTGSTVNVHADGSTNLKDAETVYLIKKDGGTLLTDAAIKQNVDVFVGVTAKLNGTVTKENNNLVLTTKAVPTSSSGSSSSSGGSSSSGSSSSSSGSGSSSSSSASSNTSNAENAESASDNGESSSSGSSSSASTPSVTINPDTKSTVETRAAQSNVVNMGSDYLVTTTMAQIANADYGADGFASFGGSSGSAHMRYKTGSHVDRSPGARSLRRGTGTMTAISTTARTAAARRATRAAASSHVRNLRADATWRVRSARARRRRTTPRPTLARATARMRRTSAHTLASAGCCRCTAARSTSMAAISTAARAATAHTSRRARRMTSTSSTATA